MCVFWVILLQFPLVFSHSGSNCLGKMEPKSVSCCYRREMLLEHGDAFKSIGRVNAVDHEFQSKVSSPVGVGCFVGKRLDDEYAGAFVGRFCWKCAIVTEVETVALVGHFGKDAAAAGAEANIDFFFGDLVVSVDDGILDGFERGN